MAFDPSAQGGEFPATQAFKDAFKYEAPQISTRFGQDAKYFGGEDYKAAKQSGFSDADIKDFLNQNLDLLRGPNVPGGSSEIGQLMKPAEQRQGDPGSGLDVHQDPIVLLRNLTLDIKSALCKESENRRLRKLLRWS